MENTTLLDERHKCKLWLEEKLGCLSQNGYAGSCPTRVACASLACRKHMCSFSSSASCSSFSSSSSSSSPFSSGSPCFSSSGPLGNGLLPVSEPGVASPIVLPTLPCVGIAVTACGALPQSSSAGVSSAAAVEAACFRCHGLLLLLSPRGEAPGEDDADVAGDAVSEGWGR